jgi:uncharacterized 2Fe-2S/4Fe-4S cluster protein (DUF4445 family)
MAENYSVTFKLSGGVEKQILVESGLTLKDAAEKAKVSLDAPCSGNGVCGKCLVRVLEGSTGGEKSGRIDPAQWEEGWRLACQAVVQGGLSVEVPEAAGAFKSRMKIAGLGEEREQRIFDALRAELENMGFLGPASGGGADSEAVSGDSGIELVEAELTPPDMENPAADRERLIRYLSKKINIPEDSIKIDLFALRKLPHALRDGAFSCSCVLRRKGDGACVLDLFPKGAGPKGKNGGPVLPALAIDIGTTTVALVLTDLLRGGILALGSEGNAQIPYGGDVINRIISAGRPGGLEKLKSAVLDGCIVPLLENLAREAGIETLQIYRAAVAGNTTMTHLFTGTAPDFLRLEPYVPAFFGGGPFKALELGLPLHPSADVLLAPSVGSYVGGDISAGVFASLIFRKESLSLFIDLGTNGELVLGSKEFLMSCACSAGPAFEGGEISCGMRAAPGAIEACRINPETGEPSFTVIGDMAARAGPQDLSSQAVRPVGICGSGLIDIIGELFAAGMINPKGKFVRDGRRIGRDEWGMGYYIVVNPDETGPGAELRLSEGDIDNFIRAKGAIFSAIRTMLDSLGFGAGDIADIYIAGGIGSGINVERAVRIGMLPKIPLERYHYIGNTSLSGAWAMVQSQKAAAMVDKIAGNMTYLELSSHPSYMEEFIAACFLPHTNGALFA